jgi:hypothetical protein
MNKNQYKVLQIPNFFKTLDLYNYEEKSYRELVQEELPRYVEITPVFNRDGWYYDRIAKIAWYEYNGMAWINDRTDDFLYELQCLNARWLNKDEVKAIKTLIVYGSCPKSLYEIMYQHELNTQHRNICRNSRCYAEKFWKEIKEKRTKNEN